MSEKWIVFYNKLNGNKLSSMTVEGSFKGEVESVKELLAYENGIDKSNIEVKFE